MLLLIFVFKYTLQDLVLINQRGRFVRVGLCNVNETRMHFDMQLLADELECMEVYSRVKDT